MTFGDMLCVVGAAISVRLDDESHRALMRLEAMGMTRSEAVRSSVVAAATRLTEHQSLAAEAAALEADEDDRREMREVAALMEELRASW